MHREKADEDGLQRVAMDTHAKSGFSWPIVRNVADVTWEWWLADATFGTGSDEIRSDASALASRAGR